MPQKGFTNLQKHIDVILRASRSDESYIKVIGLCRDFIKTNKTTNTYNLRSINNIVKYREPNIEKFLFNKIKIAQRSPDVIKAYLVKTPVPSSAFIYDAVKGQNDSQLNKVALRQLLYKKKNLETSIELIKRNGEIYRYHGVQKLQKTALLYFAGVLTFHGILEIGIKGHEFIHAMFDMYFINLFLLTLLFGGSKREGISWRPVNSIFHKYFYDLEYQLCAKYVSIYRDLFTTNVSNFHDKDSKLIRTFQDGFQYNKDEMDQFVHKKLRELGFMITQSPNEEMFREYWDHGGQGFEWVEPDKDPVDFLNINEDS
ncbi:putative membrane protein [Wickerhamomyces ciferrii]|uniref:Membrane protein n=1 Tax=Wickerhamomyces ciferrii (strain ATCC 14091 / BCRC 22168 / CBS 111 / JCM 3599 / NBRC 0793 / NRRL Y-1031 F-60-10) TaxID=1206466 RepID=K0KJG6_WICCF|nr:uncharacterized protein BN7_780 [Wickerhamomyces ciferrii]CCH41243.1 putative membrane protein [Wickerhamomyces ciferrii]